MAKADREKVFQYEAIFCGVENVRAEYVERCVAMGIPYSYIKKNPGKHFAFLQEISSAIQASKPDIIFLHGSIHIYAASLARLKSGSRSKIVIRETQAMELKTRKEKLSLWLAMSLADKIVFLSDQYQATVKQRMGSFYRNQKAVVIPNGIDLEFFKGEKSPVDYSVITIGMASRLVDIKDHATLIKSIGIIKKQRPRFQTRLVLAGDGETMGQLKALSAKLELDDNIVFTGTLNENELVKFYQSLDIYVHASFGETMSTSIMQAMACELPVIASDVDGINNMIQHQANGILVPTKEPEKLAGEIILLIDDAQRRQALASAAREYAEQHFSNDQMWKQYAAIFKN